MQVQTKSRLRNSVAHCRVNPFPNDDRPCEGFFFADNNGFEAKIPTNQIKSNQKLNEEFTRAFVAAVTFS